MTVEGENDDIPGLGQTEATHELCSSIPNHRRIHYMQKGVGHYGVFNGSRFKSEIVPRISDFIVSSANPKSALAAAAEKTSIFSVPRPNTGLRSAVPC